MNITILDAELAEPEHLAAAIQQALRWSENATIFVKERVPADAPAHKHPGWIEYFVQNSQIYLAVIQRQPGAAIETHS